MIIDEQPASTQIECYLSFEPTQKLKTQVIEDQSEPFYNFAEKFNLLIDENQFINAELILEVYDMSGIK